MFNKTSGRVKRSVHGQNEHIFACGSTSNYNTVGGDSGNGTVAMRPHSRVLVTPATATLLSFLVGLYFHVLQVTQVQETNR